MPAVAVQSLLTPFGIDVAAGLTSSPKTLPPSWLYDEVGSALFEVITLLPEYGVTRAEGALLERVSTEIMRAAGNPRVIVELGSGTGTKTKHLLTAAARSGTVQYRPIDISGSALDACRSSLGKLINICIRPIEATYMEGLDTALARRAPGEKAMVLFLGSTIGNFERPEMALFLRAIRQRMEPGDSLLLGADLVKPAATLIDAYDDPAGVTAAFNMNLLTRINRELGGAFNTRTFAHEARYNERLERVEMHLRSLVSQKIYIAALDRTISFEAGETIWTEASHKFKAADLETLGNAAGFSCVRQWVEHGWGFAETLFLHS